MIDFIFNPNGRVSRKGIWIYIAGVIVVSLILEIVPVNPIVGALLFFISLLMAWSQIAVEIKRFHDRNMTGWWVLLFVLIMIPGFIWMAIHIDPDLLAKVAEGYEPTNNEWTDAMQPRAYFGLAWVALIVIVQFVILAILPGTEGDNRFGTDPKATPRGLAS